MRDVAAAKFDGGEKCGAEANMAKLLSSEAAWEAANACLDAHGGYGFARERAGDQRYGTGSIPVGTLSGDLLYTSGQWTVGAGGSYGGALVRGYRAGLVRIQASYRLGQ